MWCRGWAAASAQRAASSTSAARRLAGAATTTGTKAAASTSTAATAAAAATAAGTRRAATGKEAAGPTETGPRRLPRGAEIQQLVRLARPQVALLSGSFGLLAVSSAVSLSIPWGMGRVIDMVARGSEALPVGQLVAGGTALFGVAGVAAFARTVLMKVAGERIVRDLRRDLFQAIVSQDMGFFDRNRTGELINRLSADTTLVGKSITNNLMDGSRSVLQALVGVSLMVYISPQLALIMLSIVPPVAIGAVVYGRFVRKISKQTQDALSDATKVAEERLSNIRTVRAFAQEVAEARRYGERVLEVFGLARREALISGGFHGAVSFCANMSVLAMMLSGGSMVQSGAITVGDLTSYMLYTGYVGGSVVGLSSFYTELMRGVGASTRIFELKDQQTAIPIAGGATVVPLAGHVQFKDVHFRYPTRPESAILRGINITFEPGTMTAIVGESGSGKSTIGSLLLRFYDPESGTVTVDGRDVRDLDPSWLRQHIGVVNQDPQLFAGSVAQNIAYSRPDATDAEIEAAARQANAYDFISSFPNKFATYVGERGLSLSGGQKQRIAIARALLKNPKILILDEATSALDAESEFLVQDAMERIMQHKGGVTQITIAHRLSTIQSADQVVVLANGTVGEVGTYQELLSRPNGLFRRLVDRQKGALV